MISGTDPDHELHPSNDGFKELGTDKLKTFINIRFNSMSDAKQRLQMSPAEIRSHYFELQKRLYCAYIVYLFKIDNGISKITGYQQQCFKLKGGILAWKDSQMAEYEE